jgi:hypothetical protein
MHWRAGGASQCLAQSRSRRRCRHGRRLGDSYRPISPTLSTRVPRACRRSLEALPQTTAISDDAKHELPAGRRCGSRAGNGNGRRAPLLEVWYRGAWRCKPRPLSSGRAVAAGRTCGRLAAGAWSGKRQAGGGGAGTGTGGGARRGSASRSKQYIKQPARRPLTKATSHTHLHFHPGYSTHSEVATRGRPGVPSVHPRCGISARDAPVTMHGLWGRVEATPALWLNSKRTQYAVR